MNSQGANLFGGNTNKNAPGNGTGGIFGNNSSVPASGGLFGNNQPQGQSQGNIFSNTNTNTSVNTGGVTTNNSSSTPANSSNAPSPNLFSGGFFGNQAKQPAKLETTNTPANTLGAGGSFGNNTNTSSTAPVQSGLSGGQTATNTPFGQTTAPLQSTPNPSTFPSGGLKTTTPSFGNSITVTQPSTGATTTTSPNLLGNAFNQTTTPLTTSLGTSNTPFGTTQPTEPAKPSPSGGLSFGFDKKPQTSNTTASTNINPTTGTSAPTSTAGTLFTNKAEGSTSSNPINASNPLGQQPQNQPQPQNSAQDLQQKTALDFQKSSKSAKQFIDEWKKTLMECYRQINQQCENIKSYSKDRKQNYNVINNFKQLEPVVTQNKKATDSMLDNIQRKQYYIMDVLNKLKEEIVGDTNAKYPRQHTLTVQIRDTRDIKKQIKAEEQKYGGEQEEDASNSQLKNIFFNLDSVENEMRRLSHVLDHYFAKSN